MGGFLHAFRSPVKLLGLSEVVILALSTLGELWEVAFSLLSLFGLVVGQEAGIVSHLLEKEKEIIKINKY